MKQLFWFTLFSIVLVFNFIREQQYILIYYTSWTFILETTYFGLQTFKIPRLTQIANQIWPFMYAPAIVVCLGFWIIVAPVHFNQQPPGNIFLLVVTHGFNMVAVLTERKIIFTKDMWKPIMYTIVYNLFLAIYVGGGGRSISGKLPYWYAQYDKPIGWIFAALVTTAVTVVHFIKGSSEPKENPRQYNVLSPVGRHSLQELSEFEKREQGLLVR